MHHMKLSEYKFLSEQFPDRLGMLISVFFAKFIHIYIVCDLFRNVKKKSNTKKCLNKNYKYKKYT